MTCVGPESKDPSRG